jgi:hypothetical protein
MEMVVNLAQAQARLQTGMRTLVLANVTCHRMVQLYLTVKASIQLCPIGSLTNVVADVHQMQARMETSKTNVRQAHLALIGTQKLALVNALRQLEVSHQSVLHLNLTGTRIRVLVNALRRCMAHPTVRLSIHSCLTGTKIPAPAFATHLRMAKTKALTSTNAHQKCQTGTNLNADVDAQLMKM